MCVQLLTKLTNENSQLVAKEEHGRNMLTRVKQHSEEISELTKREKETWREAKDSLLDQIQQLEQDKQALGLDLKLAKNQQNELVHEIKRVKTELKTAEVGQEGVIKRAQESWEREEAVRHAQLKHQVFELQRVLEERSNENTLEGNKVTDLVNNVETLTERLQTTRGELERTVSELRSVKENNEKLNYTLQTQAEDISAAGQRETVSRQILLQAQEKIVQLEVEKQQQQYDQVKALLHEKPLSAATSPVKKSRDKDTQSVDVGSAAAAEAQTELDRLRLTQLQTEVKTVAKRYQLADEARVRELTQVNMELKIALSENNDIKSKNIKLEQEINNLSNQLNHMNLQMEHDGLDYSSDPTKIAELFQALRATHIDPAPSLRHARTAVWSDLMETRKAHASYVKRAVLMRKKEHRQKLRLNALEILLKQTDLDRLQSATGSASSFSKSRPRSRSQSPARSKSTSTSRARSATRSRSTTPAALRSLTPNTRASASPSVTLSLSQTNQQGQGHLTSILNRSSAAGSVGSSPAQPQQNHVSFDVPRAEIGESKALLTSEKSPLKTSDLFDWNDPALQVCYISHTFTLHTPL